MLTYVMLAWGMYSEFHIVPSTIKLPPLTAALLLSLESNFVHVYFSTLFLLLPRESNLKRRNKKAIISIRLLRLAVPTRTRLLVSLQMVALLIAHNQNSVRVYTIPEKILMYWVNFLQRIFIVICTKFIRIIFPSLKHKKHLILMVSQLQEYGNNYLLLPYTVWFQ